MLFLKDDLASQVFKARSTSHFATSRNRRKNDPKGFPSQLRGWMRQSELRFGFANQYRQLLSGSFEPPVFLEVLTFFGYSEPHGRGDQPTDVRSVERDSG